MRCEAGVNALNIWEQTPLHTLFDVEPFPDNQGEDNSPDNEACREIVKYLLKHGADLEAVEEQGHTPLGLACLMNFAKSAEILLGHIPASERAKHLNSGRKPPLLCAALNPYSDLALIELLLEAGADLDHVVNEDAEDDEDEGSGPGPAASSPVLALIRRNAVSIVERVLPLVKRHPATERNNARKRSDRSPRHLVVEEDESALSLALDAGLEMFLELIMSDSPLAAPNLELFKYENGYSTFLPFVVRHMLRNYGGRENAELFVDILRTMVDLGWSVDAAGAGCSSPLFVLLNISANGLTLSDEVFAFLAEAGARIVGEAEVKKVVFIRPDWLAKAVKFALVDARTFPELVGAFEGLVKTIRKDDRQCLVTMKHSVLQFLFAVWLAGYERTIPLDVVKRIHEVINANYPAMPFNLTLLDKVYERALSVPSLQKLAKMRVKENEKVKVKNLPKVLRDYVGENDVDVEESLALLYESGVEFQVEGTERERCALLRFSQSLLC